MINQEKTKEFELVNDKMNPIDAKDLIVSYYDKAINYYKIHQLKMWVRDQNINSSHYDQIISSLTTQKERALATVEVALNNGCDIQFKGNIDFNIILN